MTLHRIWLRLVLALVLLGWSPMALAGPSHGRHPVWRPHPVYHGHWHGYYGPRWSWPVYPYYPYYYGPNYYVVPSTPPSYYVPPVTLNRTVTGAVAAVQPPPTGGVGYLTVSVSRSILGGREVTTVRYPFTEATPIFRHGQVVGWPAMKLGEPVTVQLMSGTVVRVDLLGT